MSGEQPGDGRRPRIAVLTTHGMTLQILARGQLAFLAGRGFDVVAVAAPGDDLDVVARRERVATAAVPGLRREISPPADLLALLRLRRLFRRLAPDLVLAGTPKAGLLGTLAARWARVPRCVYALRGLRLETATGARRAILATTERIAAGAAHRVLCVSPSLRRRYVELGLARPDRVSVPGDGSSNGVDVKRYQPATGEEKQAARRAFGLPAAAVVVGFVGRFTRDKGIEDLARIWIDELRPSHPDLHLLLLGDWEEGDPVSPSVRAALDGDPRVVLPGFVADTAPGYHAMDLLVFPSHREGFPNVPLEAAASGLPVTGFAATGTVDAVADGESGLLVPVGDRNALTVAVVRYLSDPILRRSHGEAGRSRATTLFANERVWSAWADALATELAAAGVSLPSAAASVLEAEP